MRARLKRGWAKAYPELTVGNAYRVLGIEADSLRIIDDAGEPILFNARAFEFPDPVQPTSWVAERGEGGELYAYPPELCEPRNFFEEYFNYNMKVRQKLHTYVHMLCHAESAAMPHPPNLYLRARWKHESPNDPVAIFSELDEERWEVRKVEVFRDGRVTYADGKGSTGSTELGDQQVPPIAEIASDPELDVSEIDRSELEAAWEKALAADEEAG